jgi:F420-dependent oxidoreductase-like protein
VGEHLRIGLMVRPQALSVDEVLGVFQLADEAGFDHVWAFDHLVSIPEPSLPVFDSWTLLGAAARVTERVRIGLQVTGNLYRHPSMLAKQAVTVDHLAGGRLEMGLGAGWNEPEFRMHGMAFPPLAEAMDRLDEACSVLKALWTEDRAAFNGRHYQLADAIAEPKPVQRPHPPIWIGGSGRRRLLRIAAMHADVWSSSSSGYDEDVELQRVLDDHCYAVGRDPASLRRNVTVRWAGRRTVDGIRYPLDDEAGDIDGTCRAVEQYYAAGFTEIVLMLNVNTGGEATLRMADLMADKVLPRVRSIG